MKPTKILVIRFSSIGDIILTTPVLAEMKKQYPDTDIDFLVMDTFKEAIEGNRCINRLILFNKEANKGISGIYNFSKILKSQQYDLVVDLHAKLRSILLCLFLGVKTLRYRKRSWWKGLGVKSRIIRYHVDDTIVKNYFHPLKDMGIRYQRESLSFDFTRTDLEKVIPYRQFIIMAPGAANETKKWPGEYFLELGNRLSGTLILIGGNSEWGQLEKIKKGIGERCINLAGKLTLKESGALISRADYVLANDSGPFHITRGVGTKVFVIFGPTDPNMFEYDDNAILIYQNEKCAPCSLHGDTICPKGHFHCMKKLTPEIVHDKIYQELSNPDSS